MKTAFKRGVAMFMALAIVVGLLPSYRSYADQKRLPSVSLTDSEKKFQKLAKKELNAKHAPKTVKVENPDEKVRVILRLNGTGKVEGESEDSVQSEKEYVKEQIQKLTSDVSYHQSFDYLFNGFSVDIAKKYVPELSKIKGVSYVSLARKFKPVMNDAVEISHASKLWGKEFGSHRGEGMVISIIDTGIDVEHKDMRLTHPERAKIKDIKKSKYTNYNIKVPYGYNFVDGNDIVKDHNTKSMHGMHVAGIVAANATDADVKAKNGIRGVAPEAQLLAMKVFSNDEKDSSAYSDVVIKAIEESVKHGADVINMSLGSASGFGSSEEPEMLAIRKANEQGVLVVVAAGNEGMSSAKSDSQRLPENTYGITDNATIGSPSTEEAAFTVASQNNTTPKAFYGDILSNPVKQFEYQNGGHKELWDAKKEYELVDVEIGKEENYEGKNLEGKVALIHRGEIAFSKKLENAKKHKAIGAIVANNEEADFGMAQIEAIELPSITVTQSVGEELKKASESNTKVKLAYRPNLKGAGEISTFTSNGPTPELDFKPEVAAPGGNIVSTLNDNKYGEMSGTSMATPHVAGASALIMGALKDEGFKSDDLNLRDFVRLSLTNTTEPIQDVVAENGLPVTPRRQGAGSIRIDKAYQNRVLVREESGKAVKALREFGNTATFTLTLKNYSDKEHTYTVNPGKVLTEDIDVRSKSKDRVLEGATLTPSSGEVAVPAHGEAKVTFTLNTGASADLNKYVEGFITFVSKDGAPNLNFPYMGFSGDWGKEQIIDEPNGTDNSQFNITGLINDKSYLGSSFDREEMKDVVDPEEVGISPNGDDDSDYADLKLAMFRNAKKITVDIVKEKTPQANSIIRVGFADYVNKTLASSPEPVGFYNGRWDGSVVNPKTGKYEPVPDGQYYYRVKADTFSNKTKEQYMYLPIIVDTSKPVLKNVKFTEEGDKYVVKFQAEDKGVGFEHGTVGYYFDDASRITEVEPQVVNGQEWYIAKVAKSELDSSKKHVITVGALDGVGNVRTMTFAITPNTVYLTNIPEKTIGPKNSSVVEGSYKLQGIVSSNIKEVVVNGVKAEIEEDLFEVLVPLKEGTNKISWVAKDGSGKVVSSADQKNPVSITYDATAPKLTITSPDPDSLIEYTTDKKEITVKGVVSDNMMKPQDIDIRVGAQINKKTNADGTFVAKGNADWSNILKVRAADNAGNETVISLKTKNTDVEAPLNVYYDGGLEHLMFTNNKHKLIKDDQLTIAGHLSRPAKSLLINGESVKINDDLTFSTKVALTEIANNIPVIVHDLDDTVAFDSGILVYYDKTLPNVAIDQKVEKDGTIYTKTNPTLITGKASDNGFEYKLYMNGNMVSQYSSFGEKDNTQAFKYSAPSENGMKLLLEMVDGFSNFFSKTYTFVFDNQAPVISVGGLNGDMLIAPGALNVTTNEEARLTVSLDNRPYNGEKITDLGGHTLKVRAVDKAGNVSEIVKEFTAKIGYDIETHSGSANAKTSDWSSFVSVHDSFGNKVGNVRVYPIGEVDTTAGTRTIRFLVSLPDGSTKEVGIEVTFEGDNSNEKEEKAPVAVETTDVNDETNEEGAYETIFERVVEETPQAYYLNDDEETDSVSKAVDSVSTLKLQTPISSTSEETVQSSNSEVAPVELQVSGDEASDQSSETANKGNGNKVVIITAATAGSLSLLALLIYLLMRRKK